MYGIAELIEYPNSEDPKLQRIELFDSLEEAIMLGSDRKKYVCLCN